MKIQIKADLMLVGVTLCWGISYWLIDISLTQMGTFTLNTLRFLGAFLIAAAFAFTKLKTVNRITLKYSAILGLVLFFVYIGATYGVKYTTLSNAGFLCALSVVITPIFAYVFLKQRPEKKLAVTVVMCLAGIALLTLKEDLKPALGDIFSILCAVFYAIHLLVTEHAVKKPEVNAFQLGVFQLSFTGLYYLIIAILVENPSLPHTSSVWLAVLFLIIFCTGFAFIVQTIAQQFTSASHVGVIFSLEPVFAGAAAFFLAGEVLAGRAYFGALLMIIGIFVMELDLKSIAEKLFKKNIKSK